MEQYETAIFSLKEYIDWVEKNYKRKAYYRGHADINWHLIPSVFRNPYKGLISEHIFLKQASSHAWCELLKYHSYLEKLIFLQHYGILLWRFTWRVVLMMIKMVLYMLAIDMNKIIII